MSLCECGCGQVTPIAKRNRPEWGHIKGQPVRFVIGHYARTATGEKNPRWTGGRYVHPEGYVYICLPGHPRANQRGYVYEHLLLAERALGRPIPLRHEVHHINEIKSDNAGRNLVICEDSDYHRLLHQRARDIRGNSTY